MFQNYRSLILNGEQFRPPELRLLCEQKLKTLTNENWEFRLFAFIAEWLGESSTVNVRTSGTTGKPKEIRIPKDKMIRSAQLTVKHLKIPARSSALLCLSCEHIAGKMMVVRAFAGGLNLITTEPASNPLKSADIGCRIDFAAFVPMQAQEMLRAKRSKMLFGQIRNALIGGAPVPYELRLQLRKMTNNVYETFGMTETISHVALKKLSNDRSQTAAGDNRFTTLRGITVTKDTRNCLVILAPQISKNPIITNDIVEIKDGRNFKWLGRFDNMVNSGSIKLIPELLEEKIRGVVARRYFFKGMPDKKLGEKLALFIEGNEFPAGDLRHLKKELSRMLGKYEIPKEIIFLPVFKTTASGKIIR